MTFKIGHCQTCGIQLKALIREIFKKKQGFKSMM